MSFFSWMRGARQQPGRSAKPAQPTPVVASTPREVTLDSTYIPIEPSAIADAVVYLTSENDRASELCAKADLVLKGHEYELRRLRERNSELETSNKNLQTSNRKLHATMTQLNSSMNQKSAQLLQTQHILRLEQEKCKALQTEILGARMAARTAKYGDLYDDGQITTDAVSVLTHHADLRPMPFVVVLVDGDSYRFLDQNNAGGSAGPEIAHKFHREISKYILSHPQIPPHSKIIVRIFCNRSSMQGKLVKASKATSKGSQPIPKAEASRQPSLVVETMVKFAETYPLFDYLDCGGGKERVDDKIRENTHLFLADSNCYSVFLAICNDNGYVRMLERYNDNPIPSAKIVLLTNGGITPEMAKLYFPKIQLNGVFHEVYKKKLRQGASQNMGIVLNVSHIQGSQTASDYDLDYTNPPVRDRIDNMLNQMRQEKQKKAANLAIFARLPYETNESYDERMNALLPLSRPSLAYKRGYIRFISHVGLRKNRPSGVLPTAPILPFLLYSEAVQSAHVQVSESREGSWSMDEVRDEMNSVLD